MRRVVKISEDIDHPQFALSKAYRFFAFYPGLKKQIGTIIAMYTKATTCRSQLAPLMERQLKIYQKGNPTQNQLWKTLPRFRGVLLKSCRSEVHVPRDLRRRIGAVLLKRHGFVMQTGKYTINPPPKFSADDFRQTLRQIAEL